MKSKPIIQFIKIPEQTKPAASLHPAQVEVWRVRWGVSEPNFVIRMGRGCPRHVNGRAGRKNVPDVGSAFGLNRGFGRLLVQFFDSVYPSIYSDIQNRQLFSKKRKRDFGTWSDGSKRVRVGQYARFQALFFGQQFFAPVYERMAPGQRSTTSFTLSADSAIVSENNTMD